MVEESLENGDKILRKKNKKKSGENSLMVGSKIKTLCFALLASSIIWGGMEYLSGRIYNSAYRPAKNIFRPVGGRYALKPDITDGEYAKKKVVTDSFGYRIPEVSQDRGSKRMADVVFLGDSVTFGQGIDGKSCFSELLKKRLNEKPLRNPIEVINAGVVGYTILDEKIVLKDTLKFNPDVVVLQFNPNDLDEYEEYEQVFTTNPIIHFLLQNSNVYTVGRAVGSHFSGKDREKCLRKQRASLRNFAVGGDVSEINETFGKYFNELGKFYSTCKERDISLIILATPHDFQLYDFREGDTIRKKLKSFCDKRSVPFVDMLSDLSDRVRSNCGSSPAHSCVKEVWKKYFLDYNHPNEVGNELIAESLYPVLKQELSTRRLSLGQKLEEVVKSTQ